jgi:lysophospholipase L1-like esterase
MTLFRRRLRRLCLAAVLTILAAEVFCRAKIYYRTGDSRYLTTPFGLSARTPEAAPGAEPPIQGHGSRDRPYYKMGPPPPGSPLRINSLGFRGPEFTREKKPGVTRMFCVGDSNTIGLDVAEEATWPARLGRLLDRHAPSQFEVINAGFNSYTSSEYRELISQELINYSPDVLIVYGGVNDLNTEHNLRKKSRQGWIKSAHDTLYNRSMFYTLLIEKVSVMTSGTPVPIAGYKTRYLEEFAENTGEIIRLCRQKKIRVVFVRQLINSTDPDLVQRMDREMDVLQQLCVKEGVEYLDPRNTFSEARKTGRTLFADHIHLNADGYSLLAGQIFEYLRSGTANRQGAASHRP